MEQATREAAAQKAQKTSGKVPEAATLEKKAALGPAIAAEVNVGAEPQRLGSREGAEGPTPVLVAASSLGDSHDEDAAGRPFGLVHGGEAEEPAAEKAQTASTESPSGRERGCGAAVSDFPSEPPKEVVERAERPIQLSSQAAVGQLGAADPEASDEVPRLGMIEPTVDALNRLAGPDADLSFDPIEPTANKGGSDTATETPAVEPQTLLDPPLEPDLQATSFTSFTGCFDLRWRDHLLLVADLLSGDHHHRC